MFQVVDLHQHHVRASFEDNEHILTEECRIQTGLSEDAIRSALPIEQVLDEVCPASTYISSNLFNSQ